MPDRLERLRTTLSDLEQELAELDSLDAETRAILDLASREIHAALQKSEHPFPGHPTLVARLTSAAERFEVSHPNVAGVLHRMIDALGQLGI